MGCWLPGEKLKKTGREKKLKRGKKNGEKLHKKRRKRWNGNGGKMNLNKGGGGRNGRNAQHISLYFYL